jgi:hypothetical protein
MSLQGPRYWGSTHSCGDSKEIIDTQGFGHKDLGSYADRARQEEDDEKHQYQDLY